MAIKGMYVFLVARGASVPCGGRMLTFLATLANSSALLDFGEIRAGHGWVLPGASGTFHSGQEEGSWSLPRENQKLYPYLLWFPWVAFYLITRNSEISI